MIFLAAALALSPQPVAEPCSPRSAVRTTISAIGENLDRYLGRCVTLSGPASSIALFSSVEGLYLTHRLRPDGNPDPKLVRRNRLGLYSENNAIRSMRPANIPWLTVTGTVDSCARKYDRAVARGGPNSVVMMAGYCHYHSGAVVDVRRGEAGPGPTAPPRCGRLLRREGSRV